MRNVQKIIIKLIDLDKVNVTDNVMKCCAVCRHRGNCRKNVKLPVSVHPQLPQTCRLDDYNYWKLEFGMLGGGATNHRQMTLVGRRLLCHPFYTRLANRIQCVTIKAALRCLNTACLRSNDLISPHKEVAIVTVARSMCSASTVIV